MLVINIAPIAILSFDKAILAVYRINQVLEVILEDDREPQVLRYRLPPTT